MRQVKTLVQVLFRLFLQFTEQRQHVFPGSKCKIYILGRFWDLFVTYSPQKLNLQRHGKEWSPRNIFRGAAGLWVLPNALCIPGKGLIVGFFLEVMSGKMWLNTPNIRALEPACFIVSCLKLLAQWNEAFTSSALYCSLSCIPVQGGREWKIPPQASSAPSVGGRAGSRVGGRRRKVWRAGIRQCFLLTLFLHGSLSLSWCKEVCWGVRGGVAAAAVLVRGAHL